MPVRLTILLQNKKTKPRYKKYNKMLNVLQTFLGTKNELRKVEEIPALELNVYMCKFIILVRTQDGKGYEPSSLRSLLASVKQHIKKNSYSASIINDLVFEKTRKFLLSKQN